MSAINTITAVALTALLAACTTSTPTPEGRPCSPAMPCGPGTICNPGTGTCEEPQGIYDAQPGRDSQPAEDTGPGHDGPADGPVIVADSDAAGDSGPDPRTCGGTTADNDTLVLLTFEDLPGPAGTQVPNGTNLTDEKKNHPGKVFGAALVTTDGPTDCGKALQVPAAVSNGSHAELPKHAEWALPEGSVDLWVRFDTAHTAQGTQGVVGRDALYNTNEGHLAIFRGCDGSLVVRIQGPGAQEAAACTAPLTTLGTWLRVGINFGGAGLELYVDGVKQTRTTGVPFESTPGTGCNQWVPCGTNTDKDWGIAGNDNPWVIGAWDSLSAEGTAAPLHYFLGGAIDHLRISKVRRTY